MSFWRSSLILAGKKETTGFVAFAAQNFTVAKPFSYRLTACFLTSFNKLDLTSSSSSTYRKPQHVNEVQVCNHNFEVVILHLMVAILRSLPARN